MQRDFFEGGAMPLPDAARILPIIARLRRTKRFDMVILSRMARLEQHWYVAWQLHTSSLPLLR